MSFIRKRESIQENEITKCSLEDNKQKPRMIMRRTQGGSPHSNESRSIHRSRESLPTTYVRIDRQIEPVECMTQRTQKSNRLLYRNPPSTAREFHGSTVSDFLNPKGSDPLQRKLAHLQEELQIKKQELQLISKDRECTKKQNSQFQSKCIYLQQINKSINGELEKNKEEIRKLTIDKRKLESERASLTKKIEFLERFNFSNETKNLQSLRENHLQKELESLKETLRASKSPVQQLLQQQIQSMMSQLFTARKLIQSLQISNACLQKKLQQSSSFIQPQEDYASLRTKYRKFLVQYKQLRKSFQNLQKQNQSLRSKQLVNSCSEDFSLQLSLFSALNN